MRMAWAIEENGRDCVPSPSADPRDDDTKTPNDSWIVHATSTGRPLGSHPRVSLPPLVWAPPAPSPDRSHPGTRHAPSTTPEAPFDEPAHAAANETSPMMK